MMKSHFLNAIAVCLILSGCNQSFKEKPAVTYSRSAEQLGVNAVYPPRSDIQVGDIFAVQVTGKKDRFDRKSAFFTTTDQRDAIKAYLKTRYIFDTTKLDQQDNSKIGFAQSDFPSGTAFAIGNIEKLPIAAFPTIEIDTGLSAGASGGAQVGVLQTVFGINASKNLRMRLAYNQVRSYEITIPRALHELRIFCGGQRQPALACTQSNLSQVINAKYNLAPHDEEFVRSSQLLFVSKVYLAREINYTYYDEYLAALLARATQVNTSQGEEQSDAPAENNGAVEIKPIFNINTTPQNSSDSNIDTQNINERINEIETALLELAAKNSDVPTVSFGVSGYNAQSVTFKQIFQRPVVVGYEGVHQIPLAKTE
ncbi:hypothetical protein [Maritalea sp. S77]|uniref:hypothetical protein n=1 Tax=Maritalea sp. S77 TaxID=3415125 RepID=UPI003C7D73B1